MASPIHSSKSDTAHESDAWIDSFRSALSPVALTTLGQFEILREFGRGGQGAIYLARDTRNSQTVALKRLHARAASSTIAQSRLLREGECLKRLAHPLIVACHGVVWVDDEPVLLMDGIDGVASDEWARAQRECGPASATQCIVLLVVQICDAVAHAHERGILHLDLKPSNIRVVRDADGAYAPRLLDFGLAMSNDPNDVADEVFAWSGGTSGYLAPELKTDPRCRPDVRCDTYALGVLLNELLCGRNPIAHVHADLPFGEGRPTPASWRNRRPTSRDKQLFRQLSGLAHVATQPDPDLRYQSASALAADLRGILEQRPIQLRGLPLSARWKSTRTPRRWVSGALGLIAIACSYLYSTRPVPKVTQDARPRQADLAAVQLIADLAQQVSPSRDGPGAATLDRLPAMAAVAESALSSQPRMAADVLRAVGGAYRALWRWHEAEPLLEKSVGLFAAAAQANDPTAIDARADYGRVLTSRRDSRAVEVLREVVETRRSVQGADDPRTIYAKVSLAYALHQAATPPQWDQAELLFNEALADYARIHGPRHRDIASCLHNFGYMRLRQRRFAEADELYGRALAMFDELGEFDDPWRLECMHGYSSLLITRERFNAAATVLADAIPRVRRKFGDSGVQNLLWRDAYVHAKLGNVGKMHAAFKDAFATLVAVEESRRPTGLHEVASMLKELTAATHSAHATLPLESIYARWTCLSPAMKHQMIDGLQQYAKALTIIDDPAASDAILQFIAESAP